MINMEYLPYFAWKFCYMGFAKPHTHLLFSQQNISRELKYSNICKILHIWVSTHYLHTTFTGFLLIFTEQITFLNIEYPLVVWPNLVVSTLLEFNHCVLILWYGTRDKMTSYFFVFIWWGKISVKLFFSISKIL